MSASIPLLRTTVPVGVYTSVHMPRASTTARGRCTEQEPMVVPVRTGI